MTNLLKKHEAAQALKQLLPHLCLDAINDTHAAVYYHLLKVKRGETISYGELATRAGIGSARAIGRILNKNPFSPTIPCHRVIRANGLLGGYKDGDNTKKKLLEEEGITFEIRGNGKTYLRSRLQHPAKIL